MKAIDEHFPKTLLQAIRYFANIDNCIKFLVSLRWPDGVTCPTCGSKDVSFLSTRRIWKCKNAHSQRQFSIKVGTIFEDSPIPLDKWLSAMWMICNDKNGISSYEIHRALAITQKSAWFLLHRLRVTMQTGDFCKFKGHCEADETYIGGKARNMHKHVKARRIPGSGTAGKTIVMGILERGDDCKPKDRKIHSKVTAMVVANNDRRTIHGQIRENVEAGSALYSDALQSYKGLDSDYIHQVVDHAEEYVRGKVHTNGLENFWSLTERMLRGTYVSVEPFHMFRYLDEESFRFNNRGTRKVPVNDAQRFILAASQIVGKRLTFDHLTGKDTERETQPF
ncbi:MAG TPA: IS1595 family transposase [Candidatus Angelobacter sp.]|jgi:transposase-like protein|nr:IS1595 family transposase [Candidatus Angelobacter sp.]